MSETENQPTLAELRQKKEHQTSFSPWLKKHASWLSDWRSLFWFFVFIFALGLCWMAYSLFTNSFTQMYGWDYSSQYTIMGARFWDMWHYFFKTGEFVLYDPSTFFGTDNIGSNSYYGLFDPFVFICVFFPKSAVPQMYAIAACLKGAVGALAMRAYLKYMGVSENSSRVGATAFAYCGYLNFMVGFPSTVSMCCTVPLILLGIEKVIKEKKPATLVWSLCLLGMISFFYLVVMCIFGVIYAIWRYFWTLKTRKAKDNWIVIGMGVAAFAVGICLCAWTLFPSIRESSLSGRTTSIGMAYLNSIKTALKGGDLKTFFARMFEIVGGSNGRELQGLVSFFYPTCNYLYLPLYNSTGSYQYDAWTASIFCYTPMIIFFFFEVMNWFRKKQIQPIIAFALCCYLLFTTFAYYFFYAFTGDGYARWYIVLVPLIILTACKGIDHIKEAPSFQLPTASLGSALMTILTYFIVQWSLTKDGTPLKMVGIDGQWTPYLVSSYNVPAKSGFNSLLWIVFYQIILVFTESVVINMLKDKKWLHHLLIGFISVETIVCGNLSFVYGSSWNYESSYLGGSKNYALIVDAVNKMNDDGGTDYYRTYQDICSEKNGAMAYGYNGGANFHSLFNYGLSDFARMSHVSTNGSYYGDDEIYGETMENKVWSGYYANKRANFDWSTGYRYYIVGNAGYGENQSWADLSWFNDNVPFDSELVYQNSLCRVYKSPYYFALGHAVDDSYQLVNTKSETTPNLTNFFSGAYSQTGFEEVMRNEATYTSGAIFNADESTIPSSLTIKSAPSLSDYSYIKKIDYNSLYCKAYKNPDGYGFHAEDPGSFLTDGESTYGEDSLSSQAYDSDDGKLVWHLSGDAYMNEDPDGAYFNIGYSSEKVRIYLIGDTFKEDGVTIDKKNYTLAYEYNAMDKLQSETELSYAGLYGFYAPGRVKYIVYCKNGGVADYTTSGKPLVYVEEKSSFDSRYAYLNNDEHAIKNVVSSTNKFTFSTDYSSSKMVVTTLGYDAGWSCKATTVGESGEKITTDCPMYRLDGGLVGFYAPAGETTYVMSYSTPYMKTSLVLTYLGLISFFGYEITLFVLHYRKRKKEKNLTWDEGEKDDPKEKLIDEATDSKESKN